MAVLRDEESNSLWDHITGECFDGPMSGKRLEFWPVNLTTVEAELAISKDTILLKSSHRSVKSAFMKTVIKQKGLLEGSGAPLFNEFYRSMHSEIDSRLPEKEQGLGVMSEELAGKFYPLATIGKGQSITDEWLGRTLVIERNAIDGIPTAYWQDDDEMPMQLLTRWYGFAFTCPGCEIYDPQ